MCHSNNAIDNYFSLDEKAYLGKLTFGSIKVRQAYCQFEVLVDECSKMLTPVSSIQRKLGGTLSRGGPW